MMGDRLSAPYGRPESFMSHYSPPNAQLYGPGQPGQPGPPAPVPPVSQPLNNGSTRLPPPPDNDSMFYRPFHPDGTFHRASPQMPMYELQPSRHPAAGPVQSTPRDDWNYEYYRRPHARHPPHLAYSPPPLHPQVQFQVPQAQLHAVPHALPPPGPPPMNPTDLLVARVRHSMREVFEPYQRKIDADASRLQEKIDRLSAEVSSTKKEAGEYAKEIGEVLKTSREVQLEQLEKLESMLGATLDPEVEREEDTANGKETLMNKFDLLQARVERILAAFGELEKLEKIPSQLQARGTL